MRFGHGLSVVSARSDEERPKSDQGLVFWGNGAEVLEFAACCAMNKIAILAASTSAAGWLLLKRHF